MSYLWDTLVEVENLWDAWEVVRRKGSGPGVDGQSVTQFEQRAS